MYAVRVNPIMKGVETSCSQLAPNVDSAFSDVVLKADTVHISAHKVVLAAYSPRLKAMWEVSAILSCFELQSTLAEQNLPLLQSGMQESTASEVTMADMTGPVLKDFVSFMYGKLQNIPKDQVLPLCLAADAHQVTQLSLH